MRSLLLAAVAMGRVLDPRDLGLEAGGLQSLQQGGGPLEREVQRSREVDVLGRERRVPELSAEGMEVEEARGSRHSRAVRRGIRKRALR